MNGEQVGGPNQPQTNAEGAVAFDSAQIANTQAAQEKDYFKAKPQGTKSARFKDWLKQHKVIAIIVVVLVLALIAGAICLAIWLNRPPASDAEREAAGMIGASTNENIESGFNAATNLEELKIPDYDPSIAAKIGTKLKCAAIQHRQEKKKLDKDYANRRETLLSQLNTGEERET